MFGVGLLLGLLCVTPVVLVYALIVRWVDRFEPEPWWLLICAFLYGALFATFFGGMGSEIGEALAMAATGVSQHDPSLEAFGATVLAPIFEEGFKGLGVAVIALMSALGLKELDGPLDGVIYGGIIGLGFTLTEDILYVANQFADSGLPGFVFLFLLRTICLGLSHCTFTACTGLGFGIAAESRSWFVKIAMPFVGYACAMAMHATHNALPTFLGGQGTVIMVLVSWGIDVLFFLVIGFLVARDRAIVARELQNEVGGMLHPRELQLVTTYVTLGMRNWSALFAKGWSAFRARREKQLALVELAFLKSRRRRGERGRDLDLREAKLRQEIFLLNQRGVWLGN